MTNSMQDAFEKAGMSAANNFNEIEGNSKKPQPLNEPAPAQSNSNQKEDNKGATDKQKPLNE